MEKYIIIVAGGSGTRMNSVSPKQFLELKNKPLLMRTVDAFTNAIPNIKVVIVLLSQYDDEWKDLCEKHNFTTPHQLVGGGETRFHSVKNGLKLVPENCIVGVHDAARPLVSTETILKTFQMADQKGNASPAYPITESIRKVDGDLNQAVSRNEYYVIQTPQCFKSSILQQAFKQEYQPSFTDDASVVEAMGEKVNLVEGNRENIKITTPHDLLIAEALIDSIKIA